MKEFLFFFSALGAFNGIIVSCYFFFFVKEKNISNYFLGALILALSLRIGKSVLYYFNHDIHKTVLQIGLTACFFIGPFLYFYIKSSVDKIERLSSQWKWILGILTALIIIPGLLYPYAYHPKLWNKYYVDLIYGEWLFFIIAAGIVLRGLLKKTIVRTEKFKANEIWILSVYISNVIIFLAYFTVPYTSFVSYIMGSLLFTFILYLMILILIFKNKTDVLFPGAPNKYANRKIETKEAQTLSNQLKQLMTNEEVYKKPDLKLDDIAKELNISVHQLSQLLNDNIGKSFPTFINEYRIKEAEKLLKTNKQFTLEAIGNECGFKSKSSFYNAFKKIKGTTPGSYKKA